MREPLFKWDKYYKVLPKVPETKGIFIWNSHVFFDGEKERVKYLVHEEGRDVHMFEEELLEKYYFYEN